jgi:hypothetical protein
MPSGGAQSPLLTLQTIRSIANILDPPITTPPDIGSRIVTAFGSCGNDLVTRAPLGRRVARGASSAVRHVLGLDGASITFRSQSDVALHWLVAIKPTPNRDWSWDSLQYNGIIVSRDGIQVAQFSPRSVSTDAFQPLQGSAVDRSQIDHTFFDAVDPIPPVGSFPTTLSSVYSVSYLCQGNPITNKPLSMTLTLPITTPPAQGPSIASAGIAPRSS